VTTTAAGPRGLDRRRALLLLLVLGLPALVAQLALPVPRLDADAVEYFSHVRSLYFDHDLDFANEFEHFGIEHRYDKAPLTPTGHRRTIFSVGPALLWMPFYAVGDLVARAAGNVEDGYSAWHIRAVCCASLALGLAGLLLLDRPLRDLVPPVVAFWTLVLTLYATFLWWYVVYEPVMSHSASFFMAALVLRAFWDGRAHLTRTRALWLGLIIGVAASVRWQNAVLLLLPGLLLLIQLVAALRARAGAARVLLTGALALGAFALGALPQMLAWKAIFGSYLLADPPHGRDFLRLGHPYLLETFFSSRHGLLYWTPILWAGFVGLLALLRVERRTALVLLAALIPMSYVNVCSGDWWAGGSYSNRRFDSLLPLLALGLGMSLAFLLRQVERRPLLLLGAGAGALVVWNWLFMQQYRRNLIPRDDTVSFAQVTGHSAALLQAAVGTPLAWPANWIFAARYDLPSAQYDTVVGKYLFYRQNKLGGTIDLGDPRVDPALIDAGWTSLRPCGPEALCRGVIDVARVFAPLDVPEALTVIVRARGRGELALDINGTPMARFPLGDELADLRVSVPRQHWRRELNELRFAIDKGGVVQVDRVVFEQAAR
jgi:hypothetical protein